MLAGQKNKTPIDISEKDKKAIKKIDLSEYTLVIREEFCDKYLHEIKNQLKGRIVVLHASLISLQLLVQYKSIGTYWN